MKVKIILLPILAIFITSCINSFLGETTEKTIITETNYIYPDELKLMHLENENIQLNSEIETLTKIIDSGQENEQTKARYTTVTNELASNNAAIMNILNEMDIVFKKLPLPPCPRVNNCNDWFSIRYLTPLPDYQICQVVIFDESENVLAQTVGTPKPLEQFNSIVNYIPLEWKTYKYTGQIIIKVYTVDQNNIKDEYYISSEIE
ncbi:hypothetical protein [Cellulophaga baltica]|uniref:hypothetical protein n=1 Tax=Cellulophaga baltica TaxID=76594 RepID=UPI002494A0FD|nr:hypothetical protein [Cellulophaga baltica]